MSKRKGKVEEPKVEKPDDAKRREYYSTKVWTAFKLFVNTSSA